MASQVIVSSDFDAGNIEVIESEQADNIRLCIPRDTHSDFFQWFYFHVACDAQQPLRILIEKVSEAAYPKGWEGYQAVASYDNEDWFRVPTRYQNGNLIIEYTPEKSGIYFAYFAPYSLARHEKLVTRMVEKHQCTYEVLGKTKENRELGMLSIGATHHAAQTVWIIARQHPGETMAEWFVEGLLEKLADVSDPISRTLLKEYRFCVVPNMNPDGSYHGNLRTNSLGVNLNREWSHPTLERSPEVLAVEKKMAQTGVDLFLDIHGDEALPFNFIDGCAGIPSFDERKKEKEERFQQALLAVNADFQIGKGYTATHFGDEVLTVGAKWVGETYQCLSLTLEMPFKDNEMHPNPDTGWSPARSKLLGADCLFAIHQAMTATN